MGRRFDRPFSDADSDAHAVGYTSKIGVNGVHELFTPKKSDMPSKVHQSAIDGPERIVGERADGFQ